MFKIITELFSLLTPTQRRKFFVFQILIIIMTFAEIISIVSLAPFMALIGDISILERDNFLATLYIKSNLQVYEFIFYVGLAVLFTLTISTIVSVIITWRLSMFAAKIGTEIADRLYSYYLEQNWLFHTRESSSKLTMKITQEAHRVGTEIMAPLMEMNSRIVLVFFIMLGMLLYDPMVVIVGFVTFAMAYIFLFKSVRKHLEKSNDLYENFLIKRFKLINDGLGGIKDILLKGLSGNFKKQFNIASNKLAHSKGTIVGVSRVPRYLMELLSFGSMIVLVLYLTITTQGNLSLLLPILSVYALAGLKLLPSLQGIYGNAALIKGNIGAYLSIREDLENIKHYKTSMEDNNDQVWSKNNEIKLNKVTFLYPNKTRPALEDISLTIKPNTFVGFVGTSGSGKSTLVDVIIGLIKSQKGEVIIDGKPLTQQNLKSWQNKIGFVPQTIFLTEDSIAENVAFGLPEDQIDITQVKKALKLAHLEDFVLKLENGIYTKVGERGVQISGGQRQRIGIARALYYNAEVLVFDEATNALDGITEKIIMDAIHDFTGKKTLIMIAHRIKTIQNCDEIFMMEKGQIVDKGTYQNLLETSEQFKKMSYNE